MRHCSHYSHRLVGKLWRYTKITGSAGEETIKHRWLHSENLMAEVELPVKSPSWRTYISKGILQEWTGEWKVEVVDSQGKVLKTLNFSVK